MTLAPSSSLLIPITFWGTSTSFAWLPVPVCPRLFNPQAHNTPPSSTANDVNAPAPIATTFPFLPLPRTTFSGTVPEILRRGMILRPSWPCSPTPHEYRTPWVVSARRWLSPAAMEETFSISPNLWFKLRIGTGRNWSSVSLENPSLPSRV